MAVLMRSRDDVVRELTRHCGDGRLTLDELEQRIQEAYEATTEEELLHSLRELPVTKVDEPVEPIEPETSAETARPTVPPLPRLPAVPLSPVPETRDQPEWEKALGTLFAIGGFILLFNGMFWLALICWFVLPGLVLKHRSR